MKETTNASKISNLFFECVLIEYEYSVEYNSFTWIGTPLSFDLPQGQRRFVKICFSNVSMFEHVFPIFYPNEYLDSKTYFFAKKYTGTIESEEATIKTKHTNSIRITMPYLLGHIEFLFENVDIVSRVGIGEKQCNGEWSYFDLLSKKEFDFYYPFFNYK